MINLRGDLWGCGLDLVYYRICIGVYDVIQSQKIGFLQFPNVFGLLLDYLLILAFGTNLPAPGLSVPLDRRHHGPTLNQNFFQLAGRIAKRHLPGHQGVVVHLVQAGQHAPRVAHDGAQEGQVDIFVGAEDIAPQRRRQHGVLAPCEAFVVAGEQAAPLRQKVFEVLVAYGAGVHAVQADHAVFGCVEEMVHQVLVPDRGVCGGKGADTHGEEIHVEESDLRPGVEGWGEA